MMIRSTMYPIFYLLKGDYTLRILIISGHIYNEVWLHFQGCDSSNVLQSGVVVPLK